MGGSSGGGGLTETAAMSGTVEYTVRDSNGVVKAHNSSSNTVTDTFLNDAASRLSDDQTVASTDVYENIQLCDVNNTTTVCVTADLIADIKTAVGGSANNPAGADDTTLTSPSTVADSVGSYDVQDTFVCDTTGSPGAACTKILKLELTRGPATAGSGDGTLGAYQAVDVTLADGDSLQVTWTVDIDP